MYADGQLFIDFEYMVLAGFAAEGLGFHFPSTCFVHLLMHAIAPS